MEEHMFNVVKVKLTRYVPLPIREGVEENQYKAEACLICNGAYNYEITNGLLSIDDAEVVEPSDEGVLDD